MAPALDRPASRLVRRPGHRPENLRLYEHPKEKLSHYSKRTVDIEYDFGFAGGDGWGELEGIANRTDFDLGTHSKHSGEDLSYFDQAKGERYTALRHRAGGRPDPLADGLPGRGVHRGRGPQRQGRRRQAHRAQAGSRLAPVKAAVLPLSRNEALSPKARDLAAELRKHWNIEFDDAQAIGRRYRRQDEIGTPFCVTVDFDTLRRRRGHDPRARHHGRRSASRWIRSRPTLRRACSATQEDYDKLVKIAPVVAYPEAPWITPWRTSLATVGKAVGRSDKAAELTAAVEQQMTAATTEHANLTGTSLIFGYLTTADLGTVGVYAAQDPRVSLMRDFGLVDAPAVAEVVKAGEFYGSVSAERAAELTSDVFLTWSENPSDMKTFEDNKLIGQIPAIKDGHAYAEADKPTALAVTNPTPLSIPVVIDKFIPKVAAAIGS
jgi:hypothetical protein